VSLPVHRKSTGESNPRAVASWPRPPSSPIAPLARSPACPPGRGRGGLSRVSSHGSDGPVSGGAFGSCHACVAPRGRHNVPGWEGQDPETAGPVTRRWRCGSKAGGCAFVTVCHGPSMRLEVLEARCRACAPPLCRTVCSGGGGPQDPDQFGPWARGGEEEESV